MTVEERMGLLTAPLFAKLDAMQAGLANNDAAIKRLADRMNRVEATSIVQLLDSPARECRACGETIEPERRTVQ